MKIAAVVLFVFMLTEAFSQVTNIVVLDKYETSRLKEVISTHPDVHYLYDSIVSIATVALKHQPQPLEKMYYECLLDTDSKRIHTVKSFDDINHTATLIYAGYGTDNREYGEKVKEIVVEWARTYLPDGNTINENKFIVFFWGYHIYKNRFSLTEQQVVEDWINKIALKQMNRERTPNNNWEAKRLKIIGIAGSILQDKQFIEYSIEGFKKYISTAYFPDGTSNDLHSRDALQYHISGIKPCLSAFINLSKFDKRFNLFNLESESGSSIRKSVEYIVPYARGEKQRKEWTNSKVELDRRRAEAGIEKYQPGKLFNPKDARELFEWASYYNSDWDAIFENPSKSKYASSWIGLLNSPLIREKQNMHHD